MSYLFPPMVALNAEGEVLRSGTGQVFAESDISYATPLTVYDLGGVASATVDIDSLGVTEAFRCDETVVVWKSGVFTLTIWSAGGLQEAAEAAALAADVSADAAAASLVAAEAAAASAAASAGGLSPENAAALADTVRMTGNQTIGGVKTFSTAPVLPDDALPLSAVDGLAAALAAAGSQAAATTAAPGIVELATTTETTTGTDATRAVTPTGVAAAIAAIPNSSETVKGIIELATTAEAAAGTDTTRAVTPAGVAAALDGIGTVEGVGVTVSGRILVATTSTPAGRAAGDLIVVVPV